MKKWFENEKLSKKMNVCFIILTVFGVLIGLFGIVGLVNSVNSNKIFILALIASIIIFILVSLYISRSLIEIIVPPIKMFVAFSDLLAIGDIGVERILTEKDWVVKLRKDEIGLLADSLARVKIGIITHSRQTDSIASGDLTTEVTVRDEKDILGKAISKLVSDFHSLVSSIVNSSEQVDANAKQLADTSATLSQGATEQASSIEELSASIENISQNIKNNADNATRAKVLSVKTSEIVQSSMSDMNYANEAMENISTTSKDISRVINTINDIAFQTNILALNAAVEAARAGAAGKGFAVVADEVRNLSQKSAEAAKSTTLLIENSVQAVEKGVSIISRTSNNFKEVANKTSEVVELIDSISEQANEQSVAISQISTGLDQVSSVVQTNSATSEESAAASEELSSQANILRKSAGIFKLNRD